MTSRSRAWGLMADVSVITFIYYLEATLVMEKVLAQAL